MVNAVMDAIALLSSLATDLDIMLNDLRSSPSTRLLPNSAHHLQQSNSTTTPSAITQQNVNGGHTAPTGYLHSALRSGNHHQQHSSAQHPQHLHHSVQIIPAQTAAPLHCYNNQQQQYPYSLAKPSIENQNATAKSSNRNQQLQRFNQDFSKLRARHTNVAANCHGDDGVATGNAHSSTTMSSSSLRGLSPDVREIQKLPLWSYQHKQLRQPQKLHVELLQQQRETKAIASQIAANRRDAAVVSRISPVMGDDVTNDTTTTSSTTSTTSLMKNSSDIRCVKNEKYNNSNVSSSSKWVQSSSSSASSSTAISTSFFG